jgi:FMN phosphatase YigB (HAD superfamily)
MELIKDNGNWDDLKVMAKHHTIKHYSFDFWNTIAFSNPKFKKERCEFIYNFFDRQFEKQLINDAFSKIGKDYNLFIDNGGETATINELYFKVFDFIGIKNSYDLEQIKIGVYDLFLKYPPTISQDFLDFLDSFEDENISFSITSNTTFIPGDIIQKQLTFINLLERFAFCIFSDVEKVAKPKSQIFHTVLERLNIKNLLAYSVIHIGDNYKADYLGARNTGLLAFFLGNKSLLLNERIALHVINDISTIPISANDYSKFKFGDSHIAKQYGIELFNYFKENYLPELISSYNSFLIYSSPYSHIPTSSFYLTQYFFDSFRLYLSENNKSDIKIEFCKINRCQTYTDDYGAMTAEERYKLIKNDTYELVDMPTKTDLSIFIDDISITGTHQKVIENLLKEKAIETKSIFLYYAKLSNSEICPSFENILNYSFMNDFNRLLEIILSDTYKITTRTTKYILSLQSNNLYHLMEQLILQERYSILKELVSLSYDNKYNNIELYKPNLELMKLRVDELKKNKQLN